MPSQRIRYQAPLQPQAIPPPSSYLQVISSTDICCTPLCFATAFLPLPIPPFPIRHSLRGGKKQITTGTFVIRTQYNCVSLLFKDCIMRSMFWIIYGAVFLALLWRLGADFASTNFCFSEIFRTSRQCCCSGIRLYLYLNLV